MNCTTQHCEEIQLTPEAMWKFESVSATAIANDIVIIHLLPFSQRITKELPSAQYLDCELRSPLYNLSECFILIGRGMLSFSFFFFLSFEPSYRK